MNTEKQLLGTTARMYVVRSTRHGVYLSSDEAPGLEVLLPGNQVPPGAKKGDSLSVFLYRDSEDRLTATTATPYIQLHQIAPLRVKDTTKIGAFLDWGLAKDLLLPFKEQTCPIYVGDVLPVALYVDKTGRLCATMHIYDYLSSQSPYTKGDWVHGRVYEITDSFGVFVAVDDRYSALLPRNEMSRVLSVGEEIDARVKNVTEEGKLTLTLQEKIKVQMGKDADLIYERLESAGGFLPFHDKTSPEIIKREFKISKNAFKRAIGRLMKEHKIEITESGIRKL